MKRIIFKTHRKRNKNSSSLNNQQKCITKLSLDNHTPANQKDIEQLVCKFYSDVYQKKRMTTGIF